MAAALGPGSWAVAARPCWCLVLLSSVVAVALGGLPDGWWWCISLQGSFAIFILFGEMSFRPFTSFRTKCLVSLGVVDVSPPGGQPWVLVEQKVSPLYKVPTCQEFFLMVCASDVMSKTSKP